MKALSLIIVMTILSVFSSSDIAADGAKIYTEKCSMCHGPKGTGTPMGPSIKGNEFITKGTSDDIKKVIIEGRAGSNKKYPKIAIDMPRTSLSDEDVKSLVLFLQGDLQK